MLSDCYYSGLIAGFWYSKAPYAERGVHCHLLSLRSANVDDSKKKEMRRGG